MLQQHLKDATKSHHDQLEQLMFVNQIMDGSLNREQYQKILTANYLSHAYFEEMIFKNLSPRLQEKLKVTERAKLPALLNDMAELSMTAPELPNEIKFSHISSDDASLLGAMYVLEGATLGGHVIVKRLLENAHLKPLNLNYHYYQAYGQNLINKWKDFVQVLNNSVNPVDYPKTAKAASDMFDNMRMLALHV